MVARQFILIEEIRSNKRPNSNSTSRICAAQAIQFGMDIEGKAIELDRSAILNGIEKYFCYTSSLSGSK